MKITVSDFVDGASNARGITVIIDVFRAFSVACYLSYGNASKIICVGTVEDALELRQRIPDAILIGERGGRKLDGFDFGNSPTEIRALDLTGKTVVHTTHAGTQGLVNANRASEILTGSFLNAAATARYIRSKAPPEVTLVRMGLEATRRTDEDDLCAAYLEAQLTGRAFDAMGIKETLRASPCTDRFFDPQKPWSPVTDFDLCLDVDCFDFVLRAVPRGGGAACLQRL
jgi:2-phosphosulfolactate phosphatase